MPKGNAWGWLRKFFQSPEPVQEPALEPKPVVVADEPTESQETDDMSILTISGARTPAAGGAEYNGLTPDYYISTTGSDSNDGLTEGTAWAITALNSKGATYGGKTVGMVDGTYGLYDIMGLPSSGGFDVNRLGVTGGSAGNPTTIVSQTPRGAIIDGQRAAIAAADSVDWQRGLIGPTGGAGYITIDGLRITGANYRCITNHSGGGDFITIKNCRFDNQSYTTAPTPPGGNSAMFYTFNQDDILIQNCRFEGGSAPSDNNRHAVIQTYQPTNRCTVEYCTLIGQTSDPTGNMIHFKQGQNRNLIVRYCYFEHNNNSSFLYVQGHSTDATATYDFHNNVFYRASSYTGPLIYMDSPGWNGIVDIYNNTCVGNSIDIFQRLYLGGPASVSFHENIISRTSVTRDMELPAISALGTFDYNLYDSSPTLVVSYDSEVSSSSGLSAWQTDSGVDGNSSETTDPQFVATGSEAAYFKLDTGSPGLTLGPGSSEIGAWDGQSRIGSDF